ncbi:hypothetical protein [Neisseria sp. Marseille-Q6792]|uniref:hypothetical protein n=1 Tax=Neisseria sp. Marseille-Q6792 TaxID=2937985 RepID=UPI002023FFC0|nr:hypothetical protein [Neisseria sp. Marseille-Q6792]
MENTYLVISKFQNHGVIRNHNHLSAVISAQAGIRLFKITELSDTTTIFPSSFPRRRESGHSKSQRYLTQQQSFHRHSRESGNLATKSNRNLSGMAGV